MAEDSGPLFNHNFRDDTWRSMFGGEPGIIGDADGTSYALTLPTGSDTALLGSLSQDSVSVVAGFMHKVPRNQRHGVLIPQSTNKTVGRTDIIAVRYDPARSEAPGPCNLVRIPGVEGSAARPAYDGGPPGTEDFPLYAITRKSGQALNQSTVSDMRMHSGASLLAPASAALPTNVPLGTRVERGGVDYLRERVGNEIAWTPRYRTTFGERPFLQIGRTVATTKLTSTSTPLFGGTVAGTVRAGAPDPYLLGSLGGTTLASAVKDPAKITTKAAGVYQLKVQVTTLVAVSTIMALTLERPGPGVSPAERRFILGDQEDIMGLTEEVFLPAGAVIQPSIGCLQQFTIRSWYLSVTRVSG